MKYDLVVIGGGPAGMISAGTAGKRGKKVLLIEKNEKLGKKLYLTGKGRCNVTNTASLEDFMKNIPSNPKFLYSSFGNFFNDDLIDLLLTLNVKTKIERGGRVFPASDKSSDIIKAFDKYLSLNNVELKLNSEVIEIICEEKRVSAVKLSDGNIINTSNVIIATGGLSYPSTGSTGDGYHFAKTFGHNITNLNPSLIPLVVGEDFVAGLEGLSLKNVALSIYFEKEMIYKNYGELLFTDFGLSGPLVLKASYYVSKKLQYNKSITAVIDLKPYMESEELDKRILEDFKIFSNKQYKNSLNKLLPKKIIPIVIKLSGIDENKNVSQITKKERKIIMDLLKNFRLEIIKTRPISEAIITIGGVDVDYINPKTMESKIVDGMFFAGEVLDLDAFTGGYNLQIAFSTGYTAGLSVK